MGLATDWISAVCSAIAAIVSLLTLIAVYLSAIQILSRRQLYHLGISKKSLGPWKSKVVLPSLLKMETRIFTPTVSLSRLVKKGWVPNLAFPIGFTYTPTNDDPEQVLAEASWVNFLESLGLAPEDEKYYLMQSEPELVGGIVPMRWKGRDLVGLCSMLGFQSHEEKPSFKTPMPLPMQWSGPLGWLQFRASSDSCIVEYRRRRLFDNQLSSHVHGYYSERGIPVRPVCLGSRLWQSINGLYLPNGKLLYLGGTDRKSEMLADLDKNTQSIEDLCNTVMASDPTDEEMRRMLWGRKAKRPDTVSPTAVEKGPTQAPESQSILESLCGLSSRDRLKEGTYDRSMTLEVLKPCPGLLSVIVEGELANVRGLDLKHCHEYHRLYTDLDEVSAKTHPHQLGRFRVDDDLLALLKDAVLNLKPDGFYFSPTFHLYRDIIEIWKHVDDQSNVLKEIFPKTKEWKTLSTTQNKDLYHAMTLCNEFQHIKITSRAVFTIDDMGVISKASVSLRRIVSQEGLDLIWAIIVSPDLFTGLVEQMAQMEVEAVIKTTVKCTGKTLDCTSLGLDKRYPVPLMDDGKFSGTQILAALMDVFLTYFWFESCWISDVAVYDATVPQSVIMC